MSTASVLTLAPLATSTPSFSGPDIPRKRRSSCGTGHRSSTQTFGAAPDGFFDTNLPELLAGDLGTSESIFLSSDSSLTAGAPHPMLRFSAIEGSELRSRNPDDQQLPVVAPIGGANDLRRNRDGEASSGRPRLHKAVSETSLQPRSRKVTDEPVMEAVNVGPEQDLIQRLRRTLDDFAAESRRCQEVRASLAARSSTALSHHSTHSMASRSRTMSRLMDESRPTTANGLRPLLLLQQQQADSQETVKPAVHQSASSAIIEEDDSSDSSGCAGQPSVRTARKGSVTTANTSLDLHDPTVLTDEETKRLVTKLLASLVNDDEHTTSWIDLDQEELRPATVDRDVNDKTFNRLTFGPSPWSPELRQDTRRPSTANDLVTNSFGSRLSNHIMVQIPERRSSLSYSQRPAFLFPGTPTFPRRKTTDNDHDAINDDFAAKLVPSHPLSPTSTVETFMDQFEGFDNHEDARRIGPEHDDDDYSAADAPVVLTSQVQHAKKHISATSFRQTHWRQPEQNHADCKQDAVDQLHDKVSMNGFPHQTTPLTALKSTFNDAPRARQATETKADINTPVPQAPNKVLRKDSVSVLQTLRKTPSFSQLPSDDTVSKWLEKNRDAVSANAAQPMAQSVPFIKLPDEAPAVPPKPKAIAKLGLKMDAPRTNAFLVSSQTLEQLKTMLDNFPDTILLSDSLTYEAIRDQLRQMRLNGMFNDRGSRSVQHDDSDILNSLIAPAVQDDGASTSNFTTASSVKLPKALSLSRLRSNSNLQRKRQSPGKTLPPLLEPTTANEPAVEQKGAKRFAAKVLHMLQHHGPKPVKPGQATVSVPKESVFMCLRSIFPGASAFLCDALYAHLVTYDYIDMIVKHPSLGSLLPPTDDIGMSVKAVAKVNPLGSHASTSMHNDGVLGANYASTLSQEATDAVPMYNADTQYAHQRDDTADVDDDASTLSSLSDELPQRAGGSNNVSRKAAKVLGMAEADAGPPPPHPIRSMRAANSRIAEVRDLDRWSKVNNDDDGATIATSSKRVGGLSVPAPTIAKSLLSSTSGDDEDKYKTLGIGDALTLQARRLGAEAARVIHIAPKNDRLKVQGKGAESGSLAPGESSKHTSPISPTFSHHSTRAPTLATTDCKDFAVPKAQVTSSRATSSNSSSLEDLQQSLNKCIARLVALMKLDNNVAALMDREKAGMDPVLRDEKGDVTMVDAWFMRSLLELVRVREDRR